MKKSLFTVALMIACVSVFPSCGGDDEPGSPDGAKINSIMDIPGLWLCTTPGYSTDYLIVTLQDLPKNYGTNRMVMKTGEMIKDLGVPRIYQEYENPEYIISGSFNVTLGIMDYDLEDGYMMVHDLTKPDDVREYVRDTGGNIAFIYNMTSQHIDKMVVQVYKAGTTEEIYSAEFNREVSANSKSMPFWTGNVKSDVTAVCYIGDKTETHTWTDIEPGYYLQLDM